MVCRVHGLLVAGVWRCDVTVAAPKGGCYAAQTAIVADLPFARLSVGRCAPVGVGTYYIETCRRIHVSGVVVLGLVETGCGVDLW